MIQIAGFLLLIMSLVVHESGHAIAMRRRGVEIEKMGIGVPVGERLTLTLSFRSLPFPVIISPLLIGAYVKPTLNGEYDLTVMSYRDKASCYGAGIIMNLAFAATLLLSALALLNPLDSRRQLITCAVIVGFMAIVVLFRRALSMAMPVIGLAQLFLLGYLLISSPDDVGGPGAAIATSVGASSWFSVLVIGSSMSLGLGLMNAIPLVPLDGGKIVTAFLQSRGRWALSRLHANATTKVFLALLVYLILKDIFTL